MWEELKKSCAPENGWAQDVYLFGASPLPTHTPLDDILGGGLYPGLTILGGQASAGKSAIACQITANLVSDKRRVLYLTLDDTWGNVMSRVLSSWSVNNAQRFNTGSFSWSNLNDMRKLLHVGGMDALELSRFVYESHDAALTISRHFDEECADYLAINDTMGNIRAIEQTINALIDEGETPDLVIIDYIQQYQTGIVEVDNSEYSRVSDIAQRLQNLSLGAQIPFLVLSSLRKLSRDDDPSLDWFRGSGVIGYSAWAALILTKGELEGDTWRESVVNVVKNKGGRAGIKKSIKLWGGYSYTEEMKESNGI